MTEAEAAVLDMMRSRCGSLELWPGGFWTYPGCGLGGWNPTAKRGKGERPPAWHAPARVVHRLIDQGLVAPDGAPDHMGRTRAVRLTEAGRKAT